ncbi:hypothetical protein Chor_014771 [Crotalus horridus]
MAAAASSGRCLSGPDREPWPGVGIFRRRQAAFGLDNCAMNWLLRFACITLVCSSLAEANNKAEPRRVVGRKGERALLRCNLLKPDETSPPLYVIEWVRFGFPLPIFIKFGLYSPRVDPDYVGRVRIQAGASLQIDRLRAEDQGWYECRVLFLNRPNNDDEFQNGTWIHLIVNWPPVIVVPPKDVTVNLSQNAFFACQADAYPANLTYSCHLRSRIQILVDGSLLVQKTTPEDSGKYTCIPSNGLRKPPSASAFLTVLYPAQVAKMPPETFLPIGMQGTIRCPSRAHPPLLSVSWIKDGQPLEIGKFPGWSLKTDGTIIIATSNDDALGVYACTPYNSFGTAGTSAPTRVLLKTLVSGQMGTNSSLILRPLTKEQHGLWECAANNGVARVPAPTLWSMSPCGPYDKPLMLPGNQGLMEVTFKDSASGTPQLPVGASHILVENLQPDTSYQFSVLAQNKLGSGPFSEIISITPLGIPIQTVPPILPTTASLVFLPPPQLLRSNETTRGVLLLWEPPLHDPSALTGYSLELRQNQGKWEVLSGSIPSSETHFLVPGLIKDTFYEFRLIAFAGSYISYPSNVVNVSTTGEQPVYANAGKIYPLCFPPPRSFSLHTSPDSIMKLKLQGSPYQSLRRTLFWGEKADRNLSLNLSGGHARNSTNYVPYESHVDQLLPLERISRGPDGRFVVYSEDESREHRLEDGEPYLQLFSPPKDPAWQRSVHLRPKNARQAQQEAKASGHRQGRYFDYSSSSLTEEAEPLRIVSISPVAATPYGAVQDTQWLPDTVVLSPSSSSSSSSSCSSSPRRTSKSTSPSPSVQARASNSAQSGILQYLSLPFFKEMNVDGDWPPEENEKEDGPSLETVPQEPGLLGSPRRPVAPDQDRPAGPIYMDMEPDSSSVQDQLGETSFLRLPDSDTGPANTPLPGSLACPLYLCSRAESPPPKDQGWLWTLSSSSSSSSPASQPLPDCPEAEVSCLALPLPELPPETHKPPAANFPLPSEKFLRGSLTSQSSGRGSASFLRPPSLATSVAGSYLSSPVGEAASCQSSTVGEESRSKKESLVAVLEKRRNTSVDENYEWDSEFALESELLDALQLYRSGDPKRPTSTIAAQELEKQSFRGSAEPSRTSPSNSQSVGTLDGSSSPLPLASPEERCAALRKEFLAYRRRREMIQQRRQKLDPSGKDERFEQATLF